MHDLRDALNQITINELASRARVAPATITRLKLRGEFTRSEASRRIEEVLVSDDLWTVRAGAHPAQGDLPIQDPVHTQIKRAELAKKIEEERKLKMLNDRAEGMLLPVEDVKARLGMAGALLRTGVDGARRSLEAVCCDGCRGAVTAEFDGAMGATISAVARALKGE